MPRSSSEKVINHVEGTLTVVATSGTVSQMLGTRVVLGRLVEVEAVVSRRLRCVVVAWVTSLVREGGRTSAHLAVVVVVARRACLLLGTRNLRREWKEA